MKIFNKNTPIEEISVMLRTGNIGAVPSDTIYGLSCSALNPNAVEKIYDIKQREKEKPFIILIPNLQSLKKFGVNITEPQNKFLSYYWPNKLTVVLDCPEEEYTYLHRQNYTLGFRIPKDVWLEDLLELSGPLVSTTVNISGEQPLNKFKEIESNFSDKIDFIVETEIQGLGLSTIVKLDKTGTWTVLREGNLKI